MDDEKREWLLALGNEQEWRRFMMDRVVKISDDVEKMRAWNLVFRVGASALFSILLASVSAYFEWQLNQLH